MQGVESHVWDGDEWEDHVHSLLMLRYGVGNYQRVPSTHGGDCGLESYSTDGNAYQCYAAQEYTSTQGLFEKQRDKMSTDIRKFVTNRSRLAALFGTLQIRRWLLVVPTNKSSQLVAHASKKTREVLREGLPYVTSDFRVGVIDLQDLSNEYRRLVQAGALHVSVTPPEIQDADVDAFRNATQNSELLRNLAEKLSRVRMLSSDEERRRKLIHNLTRGYLRGQAYLDQLHDSYPELYRRFVAFKQRKERELELLSLVSNQPSDGRLEAHIRELGEGIETELPTVMPMAEALVAESIADWLMRCPLDFYEPPANN
jgi:hypothetical protein